MTDVTHETTTLDRLKKPKKPKNSKKPKKPKQHGDSSGPLRVLLVSTPFRAPLGADTWVHMQIMRTLDRSAHRVMVGCVPEFEDSPTAIGELVVADTTLELLPLHGGPQRPTATGLKAALTAASTWLPAAWSIVRLLRAIRRNDIRIVHTTDRPRDALMSVAVSKLTRAKSIVHVHVLYADWMSRGLKWAIRSADARVAVSEFVRQSLLDAGLPEESTFSVLNAVDVSALQPGVGRDDVRAEFGIAEAQPVIVTVCRLFAEKGPEELIRATDRIRQTLPDVRLLIVGEDNDWRQEYRQHLERVVDDLDLRAHVRFTGRRPDVPALMAAADVFAMPSFEEPFGLVFGEAMAMERPVVALDNGGTREVVEHGRQGLLSERGDIDALVDNLLTLLQDPALRQKMGEDGRRRVLADFRIERMGSDVAAVYRSVAAW